MSGEEAQSLLARSLQAQFPESAEGELLAMVAGDWLSDKDRETMTSYTRAMLDDVTEILGTLGGAEDEQELYDTLAFYWLELKSEWTRYNQLMNYQLFQRGQANPIVLARGTLCSSLLGRFETLLTPQDLVNLTEVAARPLEVGHPDVAQLQRFLDRYARAKRVFGRVADEVSSDGPDIAQARQEYTEISAVELQEVWPAVSAQLSEKVNTTRPYTVAGEFGFASAIDPEWVAPIADAIAAFVERTCNETITQSAEERLAAGQTAHVAFQVRAEFDATPPVLVLQWDGGPAPEQVPLQLPTPA